LLKRTSIYDTHLSLGARIVDFAGFEMPVQYTSVIEEHNSVRTACGLFDVSHMGEIEVRGDKAFFALQWLTTNNVGRLKDGDCQYSLLLNPKGGVIDDILVYRLMEDRFLVVANASNTETVFEWIKENTRDDITVENVSEQTAQIALQGPMAEKALSCVSDFNVANLKPFTFRPGKVSGTNMVISRTGYTGEDGFELYLNPDYAGEVFSSILEGAKSLSIKPIGLGARDTLRLEAGYPLYGAELNTETTPIEAGLKRFLYLEHNRVAVREGFIGKEAIDKQVKEGPKKRIAGFLLDEPGIARGGAKLIAEGKEVGVITSGTHSPTLGYPIAMGYIDPAFNEPETKVTIEIRGKGKKAHVTKRPFYKRKKLD
jgi:aminomethyltransferase